MGTEKEWTVREGAERMTFDGWCRRNGVTASERVDLAWYLGAHRARRTVAACLRRPRHDRGERDPDRATDEHLRKHLVTQVAADGPLGKP